MLREPAIQKLMGRPLPEDHADILIQDIEEASARLRAAKTEIGKDIKDQDRPVEDILTALVGGGNIDEEGMHGLGKTKTARSVASALGLRFKRIQFTPDLQPIDLTGSEVQNKETGNWEFQPGPLFAQFVLADEIPRAGPKVQSGTLEAMEEKQVSVGNTTYPLPRPFHLLATQNPIDQQGNYPLPEAQHDRFMLKVIFNLPGREALKEIALSESSPKRDLNALREMRRKFRETGDSQYDLTNLENPRNGILAQPVGDASDLIFMQDLAENLYVDDGVADTVTGIVLALHDKKDPVIEANVAYGPSPRAAKDFLRAAKAHVLVSGYERHGRAGPTPAEINHLLEPVLRHRVIMRFDAKKSVEEVLDHVRNRFSDRLGL